MMLLNASDAERIMIGGLRWKDQVPALSKVALRNRCGYFSYHPLALDGRDKHLGQASSPVRAALAATSSGYGEAQSKKCA